LSEMSKREVDNRASGGELRKVRGGTTEEYGE
jgi:hypothetical protein